MARALLLNSAKSLKESLNTSCNRGQHIIINNILNKISEHEDC